MGATATDVTEELDISRSLFLDRIRRIQQTTFEQLLAEAD
jgi:predicted DNA binding protein